MSDYLKLSPVSRFLVKHGDNFHIVRNLIMFLPGRYGDSELMSEALYSFTNFIQLFIDYESAYALLSVNVDKTSKGEIIPPRYYLSILKYINLIQNIELFLEVFASKRFSKWGKKSTILVIELIKAFLRIKLLIKNNGNMLVHHSFSVPSNDINKILNEHDRQAVGAGQPSTLNTENSTTSGRRRTLLDEYQELQHNTPPPPPHHVDSTMLPLLPPYPPKDLATKVIGEVLSIMRPSIYWIARCICDKRSWKPWFIALFIDLLSGSFSEYGKNTLNIPLTPLERAELNRRKGQLLYYLIRKPFYDKFIGYGIVLRILNSFKKIPVLKILIDVFLNYLSAMRTRYFYTSTS